MDDPLSIYPGYSLRRAANATGAELAARLAALDLRQSEASVLLILAAHPEITASALGRKLDIQRANMVPLLKRLESAGLLEKHAIDGKSQGLALTPAGATRCEEARAVIENFEAELLTRVPPEHRQHLLPALNALWS
ncbi:MAG: MarR family transcriptional regulator [Erythrobacter sp.]|nr:MAG: MarR family transcriptional regulator [Erythrobacter sp.]